MSTEPAAEPRARRKNPYVGPRAFRPGEKLPARGREKRELTDLLIAERVVLLHSPSGAGKTSLIQAGVTQLLKEERLGGKRFQPTAPLRVKTPATPDRTVRNRYVYSIALELLRDRDPKSLESLTLPQVLEELEQQSKGGIWVLIFDQFEEILTLNPTDWDNQRTFFTELGAVLAGSPVWALLSMREDYMGGLDRFLRHLPGDLRATYRLEFLRPSAAKIALQAPTADQDVAFTDEAAEELLRRLMRVRVQRPQHGFEEVLAPYVEPFQLQVVCHKLWKSLVKEKGDDFRSIEVGDIERHGDVGRALRGYYSDIVEDVAERIGADELVIREWFERELITAERFRSQTLTGPLSGGVDPAEILAALQAVYLIRSDTRAGATWYELSHDSLIEPVLDSNEEWRSSNLEPWQLVAREWQGSQRRTLLLDGANLRSAQRQAHAVPLTASEREFLKESARAEQEQSLVDRTRNTMGLLGFFAFAELVVIVVLLVLLLVLWLRSG